MSRSSPRPTLSFIAVTLFTWSGIATATVRHASPQQRSWSDRQQASAAEMVGRLDMTTFPSSIGPRRVHGKKTLADYGFTRRTTFRDGWAYARLANGSWEFGVFVLDDGRRAKRLCITDTAIGGGTYHSTTALDVKRLSGGAWTAVRVLPPVPGCG